jgi:quercetin dioxygenase-like cupin family protein
MRGRFVVQGEAPAPDRMEWGTVSWICNPVTTGAATLTVNDVTIDPGQGHDFHKHPDQDEVIIVVEGEIEQWLERESRRLRPGDAVVIPAAAVHASFNVGDGVARITVILGPCAGPVGYEIVDVSAEEPWRSLR